MNEKAIENYLYQIAQARESLEKISLYIETHGGVLPDDVNWGHVGEMAHVVARLSELSDMVSKTGEHALEILKRAERELLTTAGKLPR